MIDVKDIAAQIGQAVPAAPIAGQIMAPAHDPVSSMSEFVDLMPNDRKSSL